MRILIILTLALLAAAPSRASAEDGYDLWLRYRPVEKQWLARYQPFTRSIMVETQSALAKSAEVELQRGLRGLLGHAIPNADSPVDGTILLGTPQSGSIVTRLGLPLAGLGNEGYLLKSLRLGGSRVTVIAANSDTGLIYGAFELLRRIQTRQPIERLDVRSKPRLSLRMLNHWDNLDRTVERGYAGFSLWDWHKLPDWKDPRYVDYARANASIGINGTVLTNVNANAQVLTPHYLEKVAALADVFRPWGIRVYLTARFNAPMEIGGLATADPLDPAVGRWWKTKADEIYRRIPDFGGFLVKANSEGQPGPQDYSRTHADGANMLADALAPHAGVVLWRAFVYTARPGEDRAKQAYDEFRPLEGKFRENVILQVKNGPIDFQPREPYHPLFGAMPNTKLAIEVQATKEYLGFATHLAYLGTMWEETLDSRTSQPRPSSTVADAIVAMAGVANVGTDRNWTGSHFDQANWYALGRLAWDPERSSREIAEEWTRLTWGNGRALVDAIAGLMMRSRQTVVDYMTPLGLHHLMATGHHYGPGPWVDDLERVDWNPTYYHRGNEGGIGFDRTGRGSNAVAQYPPEVAALFADRKRISEDLLLWFHHVSWDHRMRSGRTLWDELVTRYTSGVEQVGLMRQRWAALEGYIDPQRHAEVSAFLQIQAKEAQWWRDASIAYFQSISKRPLPAGIKPPPRSLEYYKALQFANAPGQAQ